MSQKPNRKKKNEKRRKRKERKRNAQQFEIVEGGADIDDADIFDVDITGYSYDEWLEDSYTWRKIRILVPIVGLILLFVGLIVMWFAPSIGWSGLIASFIGKLLGSIGSLSMLVTLIVAIVFRYRYGAHNEIKGKLMTAAAFIGCFFIAIAAFISVGFTLLCIEDIAAGEKEQALAPARYAGHNTFFGTKIKALSLNADGTLIFCREGTDAYNMMPDKLKEGHDLNVRLYKNSKTLIKVEVVKKADESKYKIKSIADSDSSDANDNDNLSDTNVDNNDAESKNPEATE